MRRLRCSALSIGATAVLLASCGGPQPFGANAIPRSQVVMAHADRAGSWMLPDAKMQDLLYVGIPGRYGYVGVFSYPGGRPVGELLANGSRGLCSDAAGNVYVVRNGDVVEYPHGGTEPIATFNDEYYGPNGCSVDPTTGDLAVSGGCYPSTERCANVAIFTDATSLPMRYGYYEDISFVWCSYDAYGNLFMTGTSFRQGEPGLVELAKGSSMLQLIYVTNGNIHGGGAIQWDGTYLALAKLHRGRKTVPATIYQLQISRGIGKIVNTIELNGSSASQKLESLSTTEFWIQNDAIITPRTASSGARAGFWRYPAGGNPFRGNVRTDGFIYGLTVSTYVAHQRRAQR